MRHETSAVEMAVRIDLATHRRMIDFLAIDSASVIVARAVWTRERSR